MPPFDARNKPIMRSVEERLELNARALEERATKLASAVPLLGTEIILVAGLSILGARTGQGKSTISAAQVAQVLDTTNKEILYISNEEQTIDFWARVGCILTGVDFDLYYNDMLDVADMNEVQRVVREHVIPRVQVVGVDDGTSKLENIMAVLKESSKYGMVIIDYYQNVITSEENLETWQILKKLGSFLKDHAKSCMAPILLMVQMSPGEENYTRRVQLDKNVANHAHLFVEAESRKKDHKLILRVRKARFQRIEQKWCELHFVSGWFESPSKLAYEDDSGWG